MKKVKIGSYIGMAVIFFLAVVDSARPQSTAPVLRMELGTHSASIFSMALDSANRTLVTGSEDKTVRVWDISGSVRLLRILRPPVGEGEQGIIFAVAISPDGQTIACGGRTGAPQSGDACVYLFDRETGVLTRRLGGLHGWVQHLAYTPDGRFLAAVTGERGGKESWSGMSLFRLPDYTLAAEDRDYGNYTRWVESDPTGAKLATTCFDGFVRLYDLSALKIREVGPPVPVAPVSKIRSPGGQHLWGLAFSPDGTRLAVGFNMTPKVDVLEVKGDTLAHAYSPDTSGVKGGKEIDFRTLAWSADGRILYGAGGLRLKKIRHVRKWSDGGRGRYRDLPLADIDLPVMQITSLKAGGIAYASREGSFGMIDVNDRAMLLSPKTIPIYAANEEGLFISPNGAAVQFAYERGGSAPALFSVAERQLTDTASSLWAGLKASFTFQQPITDSLDVSDWRTSLAPKLQGRPLPLKQEVAKCVAIKPDRSGFLLGTTISLWLFDASGREQWRVRMPGIVWAVNTNGRVVVAALGDGTIRWFRVTDGEAFLALFPHPDRKRWVLWTPSGYYDASPGGEDFIGWHVNNGNEQAADFFPISRFRGTYYRPDVIDQVLVAMDENEAVRLANEASGRKPVTASVQEKLPPVVAILSPVDGTEVAVPTLTLNYSVRSQEPVTAVKVLVDGRPVAEAGEAIPANESGEVSVTIPPQDCKVSVIAQNRYAAGAPATIRLRWKGAPAAQQFEIKPNLYVLSVGVSDYRNADLRLDLAAKDALDFGAAWNEQKGLLYNTVEVRTLTDAQATKDNILDSLEWIQRQVTSKDVAVLLFAGHGINDNTGVFYFLPVEGDLEKLKRTGVSQYDITSTISGIAGKVLVFMDACHSGNLMEKSKRRGVTVDSAVINELASAENGAVVFTSATGRQYALENRDWGNGAFTKGVVEGVRGKAAYSPGGRITLNMLDLYVSERVKELTQGRQTPTTVKPPNVPDFPVAMLR